MLTCSCMHEKVEWIGQMERDRVQAYALKQKLNGVACDKSLTCFCSSNWHIQGAKKKVSFLHLSLAIQKEPKGNHIKENSLPTISSSKYIYQC